MAKPVLFLMWVMAPVAWPTAKLLDKVLGEDHGTVYKKSGLKTLVTLHKSLGEASDRLNQDEVTIISAVLDLKGKTVESVMTPMDDVFVMSEDTRLDQDTMDEILTAGYSRIPIHEHGNPTNFIGMLLVKILITYDPEDAKLVRDFQLATLPETRPETSCLDIINFFQEGKSHMVLVSEFPGEDHGAIGVVTLEDVIEELIGEYVSLIALLDYIDLCITRRAPRRDTVEVLTTRDREIIDESDIFIDVHKAIRRLAPAPRAKVERHPSDSKATTSASNIFASNDPPAAGLEGDLQDAHRRVGSIGANSDVLGTTPKTTSFIMRRSSTSNDGSLVKTTIPVRANIREIRQHLRHLGPSNPAINPKGTRSTTVKIKPGIQASNSNSQRSDPKATEIVAEIPADGDEATPLIRPQLSGKDGIHALRQSYGSVSPSASRPKSGDRDGGDADEDGNQGLLIEIEADTKEDIDRAAAAFTNNGQGDESSDTPEATNSRSAGALASKGIWRTGSGSQQGSDHSSDTQTPKRHNVRSGSITENIIETRGVRKVVLETTSSNDDDENATSLLPPSPRDARLRSQTSIAEDDVGGADEDDGTAEGSVHGNSNGQAGRRKTRRKKRRGGS
jgi:metal transporter CNNM